MADKKTILVADDEKSILKMVESRLKANHYDVIKAHDGDEAMEKILEWKPDLLILDLAMPGKNGYQICREVRQDAGLKNIPIIILSAWVRDKMGEDTALADVYITKPYEPEQLMMEVKKLLDSEGRKKPKPHVS